MVADWERIWERRVWRLGVWSKVDGVEVVRWRKSNGREEVFTKTVGRPASIMLTSI